MPKGMKKMAEDIPHETREKILLEWIPGAGERASMSNNFFRLLWEAYFIYIDTNGIRKTDCDKCLNNVLNNWKLMQPALVKAERDYNLIDRI